MKLKYYCLFIFTTLMMTAQAALSCPVCMGDKNSSMTAGMNSAILAMLGITGVVLGLFIAFFFTMWRRFKKLQTEISNAAFIDEQGVLQTRNEKGVQEWNNI